MEITIGLWEQRDEGNYMSMAKTAKYLAKLGEDIMMCSYCALRRKSLFLILETRGQLGNSFGNQKGAIFSLCNWLKGTRKLRGVSFNNQP